MIFIGRPIRIYQYFSICTGRMQILSISTGRKHILKLFEHSVIGNVITGEPTVIFLISLEDSSAILSNRYCNYTGPYGNFSHLEDSSGILNI